MTRLERAERAGWALTVGGALVGFLASVDVHLLPPFPLASLWLLIPGVTGLALLAGVAGRWRGREIDARRWEIVEDDQLTSGEREYAHKEAERQRRMAGTALLAGPLALGYWLAYQVRAGEGPSAAHLLPVLALAGFFTGWVLGGRWKRPADPADRSSPTSRRQ